MNIATYQAKIHSIYEALIAAETVTGPISVMKALDDELSSGVDLLIADHPALVRPDAGTPKPPPSA